MSESIVFIGIDLGGTDIKGGLVSGEGKILVEEKLPTEADRGVDHVIGRMASLIDSLEKKSNGKAVGGVGIGVPGQVNFKEGTVTEPPNLPGWGVVPVKAALEERTGKNVYIDNDANVAALGEFAYGAGQGCSEMLMVTLGTGVGGGLVLNGHIYRGAVGGAGEFGHMIIDTDGPICGCGRKGCIEAFVGTAGILNRMHEQLTSGRDSLLNRMDEEKVTPKDISDAAERGDTVASKVLRDTGLYLGVGLGNVANLLNLERIVVGGGIAQAGELLLDAARLKLGEVAHTVSREIINVVPAKLGNKAGLVGAAYLAFVEDGIES